LILAFISLVIFPQSGMAQKFPAKDITLIVPWAAGGGTDTIARALVKNAKKYFGVNVNVVINESIKYMTSAVFNPSP